MKMKTTLLTATSLLVLSACATPEVVQVEQVDDNRLSCSQLREQIKETERFEKEARAERKVTKKNVAAAVFFWPALIGTAMNTEDAIDAAKARRSHLMEIGRRKGCM